jgi:fatty-acyl-CoA synthase
MRTDEVGEICVANPGVFEGSTYTETDKNHDLFAEGRFLRTGDLGRIDAMAICGSPAAPRI